MRSAICAGVIINISAISLLFGLIPAALTSIILLKAWLQVAAIENLWKVNDEWWRGAEKEISRLYYMLRLENSQQLTVYLDLITDNWCRQAG